MVGLFSCDGVVVVEDPPAPEPAPLPSVSIVRTSTAVVPDSISWNPKGTGKEKLVCTGTNCTIQLPLGKDTAQLSLWKYGVRLGVMQVYMTSSTTPTVGAIVSKDDLANKLLTDFATLAKDKPDSVAKLGADARSRLVAYYAQRLLVGDSDVAGFPASIPAGLSTDQVDTALVQAAARSGKGWAAAASVGSGLDSTKVVTIAQDLVKNGQLKDGDLSTLQQPGKVTPPDPQGPVLDVTNGGDATVPNPSASWLVKASATPADDIDSIQVNNQRFAASKCSVWVDLSVGANPIKVSVLAKNGKRASESFTITRKGKSNDPILLPVPGTYERAQWVKIFDTTSGAVLEWSLDGSTWSLFKDSILVAVPETLQVRSSVPGRDPARMEAVYVIKNVEPVVFDPKAGSYAVGQTVNFRSSTSGVSYECSFQGGSWSGCSGRYTVQQSGMLRVRTSRPGMTSALDSADYRIHVQAVGSPVLSLVSGSYDGDQSVTISCAVSGCQLDWSTDSSVWTPYTAAVKVDRSLRLYARSAASGSTAITWADYSIALAPPKFDPEGGSFDKTFALNLIPARTGAVVMVSTDSSRWTVLDKPLQIASNTKVWAWDSVTGMARSQVVSAQYRIRTTAPRMEPAGGSFQEVQKVVVTDSTSGATILVSKDSTDWTEVSGPVTMDKSGRLWARATAPGMEPSVVVSADFSFSLSAPEFSPAAGTYSSARKVGIKAAAGAEIRYTLDGSDPTAASSRYSDSLSVAATTTLKAIALRDGWKTSSVATASYTITGGVAAPTFSPAAGTFSSAVKVALATATSGAEIRYTTDGTDPTSSSNLYADSIAVSASQTVKAIAMKSGWATSAVASASYTITGTVAQPTATKAAGTYTAPIWVKLSSTTDGAQIRYTLDGSVPDSSSTLFADSIQIDASKTLKAVAFKFGWAPSAVSSFAYTITGTVAQPTSSKAAGTYTAPIIVKLSSATDGAQIRYTLDGSVPDSSSTLYTDSIMIAASKTLKAAAFKSGWAPSAVASFAYTITGTVAQPTSSKAAGTYTAPILLKLSSATDGAQIRYTLDGSVPDSSSTLYTDSILISASKTVKAAAFKSGWASSTVATYAYTITGTVAQPTSSVAAGTYTAPIWVKLSSRTSGAEIRYTLDGTIPDANSALFADSVQITTSKVLRVRAFKFGWVSSTVSNFTYVITGTVAAPVITPASGTYSATQPVTITTTTMGAEIYYTTDGSAPNTTSTLYSGAFTVTTSTTVRAIALKATWAPSAVATSTITISLGRVAIPVIKLAAGSYAVPQSVSITCATSGAQIRYTTDGTAPTESSTLYSGPIAVSKTQVITAAGFRTNYTTSSTVSRSYTITDFSVPWKTGIAYGSVLDARDGQTYRTVKIGTQTWMAQALNYSANGTLGVCSGGNQAGCDKFGRLYTWSETRGISTHYDSTLRGGTDVGVAGICPADYHVPSLAEWKTLESEVDATKAQSGYILKATAGWSTTPGSDDYGFRGLPAGGYVIPTGYYAQGTANYLWSATESDEGTAYGPDLYDTQTGFASTWNNKYRSTTLRCIAD